MRSKPLSPKRSTKSRMYLNSLLKMNTIMRPGSTKPHIVVETSTKASRRIQSSSTGSTRKSEQLSAVTVNVKLGMSCHMIALSSSLETKVIRISIKTMVIQCDNHRFRKPYNPVQQDPPSKQLEQVIHRIWSYRSWTRHNTSKTNTKKYVNLATREWRTPLDTNDPLSVDNQRTDHW